MFSPLVRQVLATSARELADHYMALRKERDRYREALQKIAAIDSGRSGLSLLAEEALKDESGARDNK